MDDESPAEQSNPETSLPTSTTDTSTMPAGMTPQMMAQAWTKIQQYMAMMQQRPFNEQHRRDESSQVSTVDAIGLIRSRSKGSLAAINNNNNEHASPSIDAKKSRPRKRRPLRVGEATGKPNPLGAVKSTHPYGNQIIKDPSLKEHTNDRPEIDGKKKPMTEFDTELDGYESDKEGLGLLARTSALAKRRANPLGAVKSTHPYVNQIIKDPCLRITNDRPKTDGKKKPMTELDTEFDSNELEKEGLGSMYPDRGVACRRRARGQSEVGGEKEQQDLDAEPKL
ncbi:MAG: hypothetical protein Q9212_002522 [Teloschistes hypoglaucus]